MSGVEAELVRELTWARTQPGEVVVALRERLRHYNGKDYSPPERRGVTVVTKEGPSVVEEAIAYVEALQPMGGVGNSSETGLALAGEDHVSDVGQTGTAAHDSSDGTSAGDRALRYGCFRSFGECLWYGSSEADARCIVLDLIVDDGVPSRGHRQGVFNPVYTEVGTAYGPHVTFGTMAAMEFATGFERNEAMCRSRAQSGPVKVERKVAAKAKAQAKTQWALGSCPICGEAIKGGRVSEVPGLGKMHADCFKCGGCSTALRGVAFKIQNGAPFCTACHAEKFGEKCVQCSQPIAGAMIKCNLGTFHADCFDQQCVNPRNRHGLQCYQCNKAAGRKQFSTEGGVITCQGCSGAGPPSAPAGPRGIGAPRPGSRNAPGRPGSRSGPGAARSPALSAVGGTILRQAESPAAVAKAPPGAAPKAKGKAKAKAKMSMGQAHAASVGIAMDYANL